MDYTTLELSSLTEDAQRALSSAPAKMMAARGMAPLANPADLATVLYQIALDSDEKLGSAAKKSASELPKSILAGALQDVSLDVRVIDYFVKHAICRAELLQIVVLNPQSADETIATIAAEADEKLADIIAENQVRLLREPNIIAALYNNKNARMSTVDRVVELAVRQKVDVSALPTWGEISQAVLSEKKDDKLKLNADAIDLLYADAKKSGVSRKDDEDDEDDMSKWSITKKLRKAVIGTKFHRSKLIQDPNKLVAMATIKSPSVKESEAALHARNNAISEDVIGYIASRGDWTKKYPIKLILVSNPKCPLPAAMRFLPHLRPKDIAAIARSRNIPSALSAQAKKLKMVRGGRR